MFKKKLLKFNLNSIIYFLTVFFHKGLTLNRRLDGNVCLFVQKGVAGGEKDFQYLTLHLISVCEHCCFIACKSVRLFFIFQIKHPTLLSCTLIRKRIAPENISFKNYLIHPKRTKIVYHFLASRFQILLVKDTINNPLKFNIRQKILIS
jgi:hypothetical protein